VSLFGGANEVADIDVQALPRIGEQRRDLVDKLLRRNAFGVGKLLNLQTVFVGARQQVHIIATKFVPSTNRISDNRRIGVPEVGFGVDIVNRCRRRELFHCYILEFLGCCWPLDA